MKKLTAEQIMARNRAAQRLMNDSLTSEAFETVQATYLENWKNTTPDESEKREIAYRLYKVSADTLRQLRQWANSANAKDLKESQEQKNVGG